VTALMALKWLGDVLRERDLRRTRQELKHACPATAAYLADWKDYVRTLAQVLKNTRHLFLVGRGASLATVGTGALIVKESAHFHAEGMSSAAFRHGPFEMLGSETFVLVFAGDAKTRDLNRRLLLDIQQEDGRAELVDTDASLPCCRIAEHGQSDSPNPGGSAGGDGHPGARAAGRTRAGPFRAGEQSHDHRVKAGDKGFATMARNRYMVGLVFLTFFVMSLLS
jgi:hypothetical protein